MKPVIPLLLSVLAAAEASIVSPIFLTPSGNNLFYPFELRKVNQYPSKTFFTGYSTQLFKPDYSGGFQAVPQFTFPVIQPVSQDIKLQTQAVSAPLFFIPTVQSGPPSSTLVAKAKAASGVGVAGSSVVARLNEAVPYSVVANAGPDAAYSSAVLHPVGRSVPFSAGAHASVTGVAH